MKEQFFIRANFPRMHAPERTKRGGCLANYGEPGNMGLIVPLSSHTPRLCLSLSLVDRDASVDINGGGGIPPRQGITTLEKEAPDDAHCSFHSAAKRAVGRNASRAQKSFFVPSGCR